MIYLELFDNTNTNIQNKYKISFWKGGIGYLVTKSELEQLKIDIEKITD